MRSGVGLVGVTGSVMFHLESGERYQVKYDLREEMHIYNMIYIWIKYEQL